jgi:hypothetical protein
MSKVKRVGYVEQLVFAALLLAAWYMYSRRSRERVGNAQDIEVA